MRWGNGGEQGSWKILDDNTMFTSFNGVDHVLTKNKADDDWLLIVPVRNPPTVMRYLGESMTPEATPKRDKEDL